MRKNSSNVTVKFEDFEVKRDAFKLHRPQYTIAVCGLGYKRVLTNQSKLLRTYSLMADVVTSRAKKLLY
jgi:hypothetical protein